MFLGAVTFSTMLVTLGINAPATPAVYRKLHQVEIQILEQTNARRRAHGITPLTIDANLLASTRLHAAWMTRNQTLQHTSAAVAENIAMGQRSAAEVVADWMSSPGHRANMLRPGHRRIGVAAYVTPGGTIYWCQQFLE